MGYLSQVQDDETPASAAGRQSESLCLLPALQTGAISGYRFEPEPMSLSHMVRMMRPVSVQAFCFVRRCVPCC
nr:MAG TPA: hypothetical protein [Caudoviricetes sp.]